MAGYRKFIPEALVLIESRRREAEAKAEKVKADVYRKYGRLSEIDSALALTMVEVSKAVLAGGSYEEELEKIKNKNLLLSREKRDILAKENLTPEDIKPKYFCNVCSDTGYHEGEICECLKQRAKSLLYNSISGGAIDRSKTFENFDLSIFSDNGERSDKKRMAKMFEDIKEFADKFEYNNIIFFGRTGIGKTHISLATANALIEKGYDVIYISAPSLFIKLEKERFSKDGNYSELLDRVIECDLLIIDDLGAEMRTQFTISALYQIVNERLNARKPMMINTNLSVEEIDSCYEERIASRIYGNFSAYQFVGKDVRREFRN